MTSIRSAERILAVLLLAGSIGCGDAKPRPTKSLTELAASWSGGRTDPVCRKTGPRGEYLDPILGEDYCQWPTLSQGDNWGVVGGYRLKSGAFNDILWERRVRSVGVVNYLRDSLSKEFSAMGMKEVSCTDGGRRWETVGLVARLMPGLQLASGGYKPSVMVGTSPAAFEDRCDTRASTRR